MSQLSYTGGGSFATSRRGGIDMDHLVALTNKLPRASHQALANMTGYSVDSIRLALGKSYVQPSPSLSPRPKPPSQATKEAQLISTIDQVVRSYLGVKSALWGDVHDEEVQAAREYFTLFAVRYVRLTTSELARRVATDVNLKALRLEAYKKSKAMTLNARFYQIGCGIEKKLLQVLPDYAKNDVGFVFKWI